jgi:hypothetical protein
MFTHGRVNGLCKDNNTGFVYSWSAQPVTNSNGGATTSAWVREPNRLGVESNEFSAKVARPGEEPRNATFRNPADGGNAQVNEAAGMGTLTPAE